MVVRRRRWGASALAVVVALGACSSDDDAASTTTGAAPGSAEPTVAPATDPRFPGSTAAATTVTTAPTPTTVLPADPGELGVLDAALTDHGTVDVDRALALVAAGYRPIPGVSPAERPLAEGGPALRTVLANSTELRAEQQQAVVAIAAPTGIPLAEAGASPSARVAAAARIASGALATFGETPADVPIALVELPYDNGDGTRNFSSPASHATALLARDGEDVECRLRVSSTSPVDAASGLEDPAFLAAVARETFHCVQYVRSPAIEDVPVWVVEGAAAFAAEHVAGANPVATEGWRRWIGEPQRPLTRRSYDAVGFFSLVAEDADVYAFAKALLGDPSADSVRRRLELTDLFDRWGQRYASRPDWGAAFAFDAPGAQGLQAPITPLPLAVDGEPVTVGGSGQLNASAYGFPVPGDVLVITASPGDRGVLRLADGQATPLAQATQSICVAAGGCACPGVPADALNISSVEGADVFIGVGPSSGPGVRVAARSLPRWCQEVAVPSPADAVDPCLVGTWTTRAYVAPESPGIVQTVTGGDGATVTFNADRTVSVDMDTAEPVVITTTGTTGVTSTTTLDYRGAGRGTWRAADGVVEVAGVDPASFGIAVTVAAADGTLTGSADLAATDVRGAGYATLLGTARYTCTPVSLALTHVLPGVGSTSGFELSP